MKDLIKQLRKDLEEYRNLVSEQEEKGLENLGWEETEHYGAYLGKVEILEDLIPKLEALA